MVAGTGREEGPTEVIYGGARGGGKTMHSPKVVSKKEYMTEIDKRQHILNFLKAVREASKDTEHAVGQPFLVDVSEHLTGNPGVDRAIRGRAEYLAKHSLIGPHHHLNYKELKAAQIQLDIDTVPTVAQIKKLRKEGKIKDSGQPCHGERTSKGANQFFLRSLPI